MSSDLPASQAILHRAVCLLLCLTAWSGPLPVMHTHLGLSGSSLQQHLSRYHDSSDEQDSHGVHWHLAFPAEVLDKSPERMHASHSVALPGESNRDLLQTVLTVDHRELTRARSWLRLAFREETSSRAVLKNAPPEFFASLRGKVPAVAITGVCLI